VLAPLVRPSTRAGFWEPQIRAYERDARRHRPASGQIVFTGSSTIRFWRALEQDMAPLPVLNRGFGGAHMSHVARFLDRLVLVHRPSCVVLYAGDNDLGLTSKLRPSDVLASLLEIRDRLFRSCPEAQLVLMSIKPSRLRALRWPDMERVNRAMQELAEDDPRVSYVDIAGPMLDQRGELKRSLLTWDGLHPSAEGYALYTSLLMPHLRSLQGTQPDAPAPGM